MNLVILLLFILGCVSAIMAFSAEDPKHKRLYGLLALFIGGMLFYLGNYAPK
jgi:hypothetical protein